MEYVYLRINVQTKNGWQTGNWEKKNIDKLNGLWIWSLITSLCQSYNPVFSSFMTYNQINTSNMTSTCSRANNMRLVALLNLQRGLSIGNVHCTLQSCYQSTDRNLNLTGHNHLY